MGVLRRNGAGSRSGQKRRGGLHNEVDGAVMNNEFKKKKGDGRREEKFSVV